MHLSPSTDPSIAFEQVLEKLGAIALQIHQSRTLDEVLDYGVRETRELFGGDRALVFQFLADCDGVVIAESVASGWQPITGQLIYDPCFNLQWADAYLQGRVGHIADVAQSDLAPCHIEFLTQIQVQANLVAPIVVHGAGRSPADAKPHLWGLLIVQQCSAPRDWQPIHLQAIKQIAVQMGIALQHLEVQQRLEEAQRGAVRCQAALEGAEDGVWDWNIETNEVFFSRHWKAMLGYEDHEIGNTLDEWNSRIHPDDREATYAELEKYFSGQTPIYRSEHRVRTKDGGWVWTLDRGKVIEWKADGTPLRMVGTHVDITERKQMEANLQYKVQRERMMYQVNQHIQESLDLEKILQTAVEEVRQFLETDRVIVYRFYLDWRGMVMAESVAPGWSAILDQVIADSYLVETEGTTYHNNRVYAIPDVSTAGLSECHLELLGRFQVRAKLVVPILQTGVLQDDQSLWGLLIAHHCQGPREWRPSEILPMQQLSEQLAIAIQQSELYERVRTLNANLERRVEIRTAELEQSLHFEALLKRITDKVRDSLDEQQILQTVVEELASGLAVKVCDTGIYNAERTTSTIAYEFTNGLPPAQGHTFLISSSPHAEVYPYLFQGQVCQFCNVTPTLLRTVDQFLTILACPILDEKDVLGDLWLFKPSREVFNDLEVRLVRQVANQCAIALRQSRLYQAAQEQVQELERLNQLKDDFLSSVSHELRTPMATIKMATQLLEMNLQSLGLLDNIDSSISRYFQILKKEEQQEINLINDLLDLTRLDAVAAPLDLTPVDLQLFLPHLAEPFIERTQQQQRLELVIPDHLPALLTDRNYLERCVRELLDNACKYTPAGEVITLSAQAGRTFALTVSNSGVEIPEAECDRIFDKFYRIPNHDPWKYSGTGLGLALVKKMVHRLGGTLTVDSGLEQGTTFTIHLAL